MKNNNRFPWYLTTALTLTLAGALTGCVSGPGGDESTGPGATDPAPLELDVFVASEQGFHVTSTLIKGREDAILVDAQFLLSEGQRLAEWVGRSGKNLKAIYITHAHPDHYFGVEPVLAAFPGTPVYATPTVIDHMREMAPGKVEQWKPVFGDDLTSEPIVPQPLAGDHLELDGQRIDIVAFGHGDTADVTAVHVPSRDTVIAGDLAYRGVHLWLVEDDAQARAGWLASLDAVAALEPRTVIAGHKDPGLDDAPAVLADNRQYIEVFDGLVTTSATPADTIAAMEESYGDRKLPVILQLSAEAAHASR